MPVVIPLFPPLSVILDPCQVGNLDGLVILTNERFLTVSNYLLTDNNVSSTPPRQVMDDKLYIIRGIYETYFINRFGEFICLLDQNSALEPPFHVPTIRNVVLFRFNGQRKKYWYLCSIKKCVPQNEMNRL